MADYAVQMKGITKVFPKVVANQGIDLEVFQGEILALVGENGAGKSTLMNMLYGLYTPTAGEIFIRGEKVRLRSALDAIRGGIGMVHQHFMLIPRLTIADNIVLGAEPRRGLCYDRGRAARQVREVCERYGLSLDVEARVSDVSLGMQQRAEIVKTLYRGAEIIILDEPTAVLTPQEIDELGAILRDLKSHGKTVIIITHKIEEVMSFSDRITVLRQGRLVGTVTTGETTPGEVTRMMVGKDVSLGGSREAARYTETVLSLRDVVCRGGGEVLLDHVSLDLRRGEVLGISGIDGSGQTQLAEVICGVRAPQEGQVLYKGRDITRATVRERKDGGIAYIPQDRHKDGLVLPFSVEENLVLGLHHRPRFRRKNRPMDWAAVRENGRQLIEAYKIRTPGGSQQVSALSGGNQQKVVVARELCGDPDLVVADQPTRGVDVGAIEFIHAMLMEKRNRGSGVLLVSLELDEVMLLSDRVAVMNRGRIVGIVDPRTATREEIGLLMLGSQGSREGKG